MVIVYIAIGLIAGLLFAYFLTRRHHSPPEELSNQISQKLNEIFPAILQQANQQLITMADQKIGTDLTNKKDSIEKMVKQVLDELTKNQSKLETAENSRISSFATLNQKLEEQKYITEQLKTTADGLRKVLSNNQSRGQFGEEVAEDILKASGFVAGLNYQKQQSTTNSSRPDFTVSLPDGTKVNIDVKFPYANLVKMSETDDPLQKDKYFKDFEQDIKSKIKEVSSREYINPEENTVDFVILFIPNEMIFSFIYERLPDLRKDAIAKKVIMAGPFSFTAILRMVFQAYENFRFQKNVQSIIGQIQTFEKEFVKYNEEFAKIGTRLESALHQYQEVDHTRTNKLVRIVDKIKLEQPEHETASIPPTV